MFCLNTVSSWKSSVSARWVSAEWSIWRQCTDICLWEDRSLSEKISVVVACRSGDHPILSSSQFRSSRWVAHVVGFQMPKVRTCFDQETRSLDAIALHVCSIESNRSAGHTLPEQKHEIKTAEETKMWQKNQHYFSGTQNTSHITNRTKNEKTTPPIVYVMEAQSLGLKQWDNLVAKQQRTP